MQTLPASEPFPIAGIAFVSHDELRRAFRFMMSHQRGEHRRHFRMMRFTLVFRAPASRNALRRSAYHIVRP